MSRRKILCLHGVQTSSEVFETQLAAIIPCLEQERNFDFFFVDGPIETGPHPSLDGNFQGPFFEWFTWNVEDPTPNDIESTETAIQLIYEVIEEQGPFDGLLGFSQGATLAAGLLLRHAEDNPLDSPHALFSFVILFSAAGMARLGDGKESRKLEIPSLHISGTADPFFEASRAVRELWWPEKAVTVTHQQGHVVPRDARTVKQVLNAIEILTTRAMIF